MAVRHLALATSSPCRDFRRPVPAGIEVLRRHGRSARLHLGSAEPITALLQEFSRVMDKRLVFFEPGARDVSFDEAWLLNLFEAVRDSDTDRYQFALLSRMTKADAADLHFAVCKAAWTLDL